MANTKKSWDYDRVAGVLALSSLFITGVIYIVSWILQLLDVSFKSNLLTLVANLFMIAAIVMISWKALKQSSLPGKRIVWVVLFWVIVALTLVGQVSLL